LAASNGVSMWKQIRRDRFGHARDGLIEKLARALVAANKELAFQGAEKGKRAAELVVANRDLAILEENLENARMLP